MLVYIEMEGDRPSSVSLEVLGEGRRIASAAGATLYAAAAIADPTGDHHALVTALGRAGADRVVLKLATATDAPTMWWTSGEPLYAACEELAPLLILIAATSGGRDLAPRLAARLGAAFVPEPSIQRGPRGEVVLSRAIYGATHVRRVAADDVEGAVVITVTPGSYSAAQGDEEPGLLMAADEYGDEDSITYLDRADDPGAAIERARIVVTAGGGIRTAEELALVRELADVLGAELAATRTVCERGLAPPDREVGVGARHVNPTLYIACGASGSSSHLGAVSDDAEIVAINRDPDAPIFRVAAYGLVGDLSELLPSLIDAARAHAPVAATS